MTLSIIAICIMTFSIRGNGIQQNPIQQNDTQHNNIQPNDTQHKGCFVTLNKVTLSTDNPQYNKTVILLCTRFIHYYAKCRYAECHYNDCRGALK
jgi:hemerythrin